MFYCIVEVVDKFGLILDGLFEVFYFIVKVVFDVLWGRQERVYFCLYILDFMNIVQVEVVRFVEVVIRMQFQVLFFFQMVECLFYYYIVLGNDYINVVVFDFGFLEGGFQVVVNDFVFFKQCGFYVIVCYIKRLVSFNFVFVIWQCEMWQFLNEGGVGYFGSIICLCWYGYMYNVFFFIGVGYDSQYLEIFIIFFIYEYGAFIGVDIDWIDFILFYGFMQQFYCYVVLAFQNFVQVLR